MSPVLMAQYAADGRLAHTECARELWLIFPSNITLANLRCKIVGKFGAAISFARAASAFVCHVILIFSRCALEEVIRIYAGWIVTGVADKHVLGDATLAVEFESDTVRHQCLTAKLNTSVPLCGHTASPIPASTWWFVAMCFKYAAQRSI
jgi:hypothetical protein